MKLQTAKCTVCGASLKLEVDKTISECSYCKSQIIVSNALDFNKVEVDKSKDIIKYRDNLKKYVRNNSIEEILRVSNQILDILPKDFLASYFAAYAHQVKGEPNYIYEFYSNILEHTPAELETVVEHINKRSDLRDDNRIIKFLNKTNESYIDKYKQNHLTRLELEDNYADIPRDIFLSYKSKEDNQLIEKIVTRLEEEGYSVWVSYRNLRPNDNENYWNSIEKAIRNTNIFLVVAEAASMRSKDVQKEIDIAVNYKKKLIEFKIDQTPHTQLFKHVFDGVKWVEGVNLKKGLEALTERIFEEKEVIKDLISKKQWKGYVQPSYQVLSPKTKKLGLIIGAGVLALALLVGFSLTNSFSYVSPIKYTITYDLDGGINPLRTITTFEETQLPLILPIPEKVGFNFQGWFESSVFSGNPVIQIPNGTNENKRFYAKWENDQISSSKFVQISLGFSYSSVLSSTGRVFTWGRNEYGELGDGPITDRSVPSEITSRFSLAAGDKIIKIYLDYAHSAAISSLGRVFTWGRNDGGQLGNQDPKYENKSIPTEITSKFNLASGDKILSISLGWNHSAAVSSSGRVFTWGRNDFGQLGYGNTQFRVIPTEITNQFNLPVGEKIVETSLGAFHSSAISSSGRVFTWGLNNYGELGDSTTSNKSSPIEITPRFKLTNGDKIVEIHLSNLSSFAISSTGRVYSWGFNPGGGLGDNTSIDKLVPTEITSRFYLNADDKIVSISSNGDNTSALSLTGRVFTWGRNEHGELGDNTNIGKSIPTEITSRFDKANATEKIVSISNGANHSSAISSIGRIFVWGRNDIGQLGFPIPNSISKPVELIINN